MANRDSSPNAPEESGTVRLFERIGSVLASGSDLRQTLQLTARAVAEELPAGHCTVSVVEDTRLRPVAAASLLFDGLDARFVDAEPFSINPSLRSLLRRGHARLVKPAQTEKLIPAEWRAILAPDGLALVPARFRDEPLGLLTIDWPQRFGPRDTQVLQTVGHLVGSGIHLVTTNSVVEALGREARELLVLDTVRATLVGVEVDTAATLVACLNEHVASRGMDVEVLDLRFFHSRLLRRLATKRPTADEIRAVDGGESPAVLADGTVVVALRHGRHDLGTLRVRVGGNRLPRRLLAGLADDLAHLAHGFVLLAVIDAARQAEATEQARNELFAGAQAAVGERLDQIGLLTREHLAERPHDPTVAAIATTARAGKMEIDWATIAVGLVPPGGPRETLQKALRALADIITAGGEVAVGTEVRGRVRVLDPSLQRLLFHVAVSALTFAATEGRCQVARIQVMFQHDAVRLTISDDGRPLASRRDWEARHAAMSAMAARAGGGLATSPRHPEGVRVRVTVPG